MRAADRIAALLSAAVVIMQYFGPTVPALFRILYNEEYHLTPSGRVLCYLLGPSFLILGIDLFRIGIALEARFRVTARRSLDGWLPLRGRWLGLFLGVPVAVLGAGVILLSILLFFGLLLFGPDSN